MYIHLYIYIYVCININMRIHIYTYVGMMTDPYPLHTHRFVDLMRTFQKVAHLKIWIHAQSLDGSLEDFSSHSEGLEHVGRPGYRLHGR